MYKLINDRDGVVRNVSKNNADGSVSFVPFVEANTDYQQYLAWLAEGNTPEPAEEQQ